MLLSSEDDDDDVDNDEREQTPSSLNMLNELFFEC